MRETIKPSSAAPGLPSRFLAPGGLLVLSEPCEVTTILGPCVAVTLWCRQSHVAAICHAMLPEAHEGGRRPTGTPCWKYVSEVIPEMVARIQRHGGRLASLEVKLFGGANLLRSSNGAPGGRIGTQNVQLAGQLLAEHRLVVVASDVGGKSGRKLIFNTLSGDVRVKRLPSSSLPRL